MHEKGDINILQLQIQKAVLWYMHVKILYMNVVHNENKSKCIVTLSDIFSLSGNTLKFLH